MEAAKANWKVRRAVEADARELERIEAACFGEPWPLELLREALRDPKYLLLCAESGDAADGQSLLGYASAWSVLDEGQIDRLAVLPSQRRRGIACELLRGVLSGLEEASAERVFLEVRAGNAGAVALYRGAGFEQVGRRARYYEDGEDAVVLRLGSGE